jgi:hypothetical protein
LGLDRYEIPGCQTSWQWGSKNIFRSNKKRHRKRQKAPNITLEDSDSNAYGMLGFPEMGLGECERVSLVAPPPLNQTVKQCLRNYPLPGIVP